jgi:hypothetical protein
MDQREKNFFYSFIGLNNTKTEEHTLVYMREYNYCAIDLLSHNAYFYYPNSTDDGLEANLSQMMIRTLFLKKVQTKIDKTKKKQ